MTPEQIAIGDLVIKDRVNSDDYAYFGFIVAKFRKRGPPDQLGPWRFVVENLDGMLAIFSAEQLIPHRVAETPGHFAAGLD